jgi:NitT/TauT family transport system substrate-binding protein
MTLLRLAVLPNLDTLPLFVAKSQKLFEARGLEVLISPVETAAERDAMFQSGQVDGMLTDLLSVILANQEGTKLRVIGDVSRASENAPRYYLLASEKSEITTLEGLKDVPIGLETGSLDEFIATSILQGEGLAFDEIVTLSVPAPEDRVTLLASGQLSAALLPEPWASQAIQQGAVAIANDAKYQNLGRTVYTFSRQAIESNPKALQDFLAAIEEASQMINADPDKYRATIKNRNILSPTLAETIEISAYLPVSVPSREEWDALMFWAKNTGLVRLDVPYRVTVLPDFLP